MDSAYEILLFHPAVRWLSKGNMLGRVYDMREEVRRSLESHWKQDLLLSFTSQEFQLTLAYLVDIFESLNHLNLLLHGRNTNRMSEYNAIRAFIAKLGLWQRRVQKGNAASFPNFDAAPEERNINLEGQLKLEVESHLQQLKQEFECYFLDLNDTEPPIRKMTRNPFRTTEDIFPDNLQEEFIEMIPQPKMASNLCFSTSFGRNTYTFIRMLVKQLYGPYFRFPPLTCVKVNFLLWLM